MTIEVPRTSIRGGATIDTFSNPGQLIWSACLFVLALAATVALAAWTGISLDHVTGVFKKAPFWLIGAFIGLTAAQNLLSAWKWQLVLAKLHRLHEPPALLPFAYNITALAAFLSQFLTVYISALLVRGWAVRRNFGRRGAHGATTSLYEQIFDVWALVVMVVPTVSVWISDGNLAGWIGITVAAIIGGGAALPILKFIGRSAGDTITGFSRAKYLSVAIEEYSDAGLLEIQFLLKMYAISIIRYLIMLARVPILIVAIFIPISIIDAVTGFTIVQASQIVAITPGQLGFREWTWSGILGLRGYDLQLAAQFAIALRLFGFCGLTLAFLPSLPALLRGVRP